MSCCVYCVACSRHVYKHMPTSRAGAAGRTTKYDVTTCGAACATCANKVSNSKQSTCRPCNRGPHNSETWAKPLSQTPTCQANVIPSSRFQHSCTGGWHLLVCSCMAAAMSDVRPANKTAYYILPDRTSAVCLLRVLGLLLTAGTTVTDPFMTK